ncbi:hypothetical protein [Aureimonas mangrovi]|uniref:hypothetical protein n=1 Tax=Aureimonas mangrovi TaxID=2758041 RepID=UPI00163D55CC|nr:hypothetical protein [Aureimonas mangrovi]
MKISDFIRRKIWQGALDARSLKPASGSRQSSVNRKTGGRSFDVLRIESKRPGQRWSAAEPWFQQTPEGDSYEQPRQ